jgi:hypothetical protein
MNSWEPSYRLFDWLRRKFVGSFEIVAAPAILRVLAGTVFNMSLWSVRDLLLMNTNSAMAVSTTNVFSALADRLRNGYFLPAPHVLAVNLVLSSTLTHSHFISRHQRTSQLIW